MADCAARRVPFTGCDLSMAAFLCPTGTAGRLLGRQDLPGAR